MTQNTLTASPTKLRSGEWGARVSTSDVHQGQTVTITTRSGKSWDATVAKVVWSGNGVAIVATAKTQTAARTAHTSSRPTTRRTGCYCGSRERDGEIVASPRNCDQCEFDA